MSGMGFQGFRLTEADIPDIDGGVERVVGLLGVDEALLARGVRADERHELADAEAHVRKAGGQDGDGAVRVREQTVRRDVLRCRASDESIYDGATGACELREWNERNTC